MIMYSIANSERASQCGPPFCALTCPYLDIKVDPNKYDINPIFIRQPGFVSLPCSLSGSTCIHETRRGVLCVYVRIADQMSVRRSSSHKAWAVGHLFAYSAYDELLRWSIRGPVSALTGCPILKATHYYYRTQPESYNALTSRSMRIDSDARLSNTRNALRSPGAPL